MHYKKRYYCGNSKIFGKDNFFLVQCNLLRKFKGLKEIIHLLNDNILEDDYDKLNINNRAIKEIAKSNKASLNN